MSHESDSINQRDAPRIERPLQVDPSIYKRKYHDLPRHVTHWHQADQVARHTPEGGRVLEVGPGAGHTTWMLRQWGLDVTTLDFDPALQPDIVGDVTHIPCADGTFDCVLAAEVLEHLPLEDFVPALKELKRVCRGRIVISLPAPFLGFAALILMTWMKPLNLFLGVPHWKRHRFDGQHYWELGKRGTELWRMLRLIRAQGLQVERVFRPAPSMYCMFLVLRAS